MKKYTIVFLLLSSVIYLSNCNSHKQHTSGKGEHSTIISPQEAIKNFKVEDGFEIQTIAAEPLIEDPVALSFDERSKKTMVYFFIVSLKFGY